MHVCCMRHAHLHLHGHPLPLPPRYTAAGVSASADAAVLPPWPAAGCCSPAASGASTPSGCWQELLLLHHRQLRPGGPAAGMSGRSALHTTATGQDSKAGRAVSTAHIVSRTRQQGRQEQRWVKGTREQLLPATLHHRGHHSETVSPRAPEPITLQHT